MPDRPDYRAHLRRSLIACDVPITLHDGLTEYFAARRPTGGFLRAVLENDLLQACLRADDLNRDELATIVLWVHSYGHYDAWGSPRKVATWLADPTAAPESFE